MFWNKKPAAPAQPPVIPKTPPPAAKAPVPLGKGHPGVFDGPKNQLEVVLMAFRNRQIQAPQFLEELFNSDVYILPLAKDLGGGTEAETQGKLVLKQNPTLFFMKYPEYSALGIYTDPGRTKPTCDLHPEFRFAAKVQAGDFLLGITGDFGLVINPYWDVNIEWSNQQVARILAMMKRE